MSTPQRLESPSALNIRSLDQLISNKKTKACPHVVVCKSPTMENKKQSGGKWQTVFEMLSLNSYPQLPSTPQSSFHGGVRSLFRIKAPTLDRHSGRHLRNFLRTSAYITSALIILYLNIQHTTTGFILPSQTRDCLVSLLPLKQESLHDTKRTRVFMGLFTMDSESEQLPRQNYRELFSLDSDRICTLSYFQRHQPEACELVYTFVMGSAKDEDAPTMLLSEVNRTFLTKPPLGEDAIGNDLANDDITHLNIR